MNTPVTPSRQDLVAARDKIVNVYQGIIVGDCAWDELEEAVALIDITLAALASEPEPQPVAEGWVLVRREETLGEMCAREYLARREPAAPHPTKDPTP